MRISCTFSYSSPHPHEKSGKNAESHPGFIPYYPVKAEHDPNASDGPGTLYMKEVNFQFKKVPWATIMGFIFTFPQSVDSGSKTLTWLVEGMIKSKKFTSWKKAKPIK